MDHVTFGVLRLATYFLLIFNAKLISNSCTLYNINKYKLQPSEQFVTVWINDCRTRFYSMTGHAKLLGTRIMGGSLEGGRWSD